MYLPRHADFELLRWKSAQDRKPLIIRGARQVGKSTTVRHLGKSFEYFLEINFEEQRQVHKLFEEDLNPQEICQNLSILYNTPIVPGKTLVFFDEVQACLSAISALRFFYEKYPELHVVAAGSLLEFAIEQLPSFGVGRVNFLFLYPLSFEEFLRSLKQELLIEAIYSSDVNRPLSEPVHQKLINYLKKFLITGGMPEVVASFVRDNDLTKCMYVLDNLITGLKADFGKYKKRISGLMIAEVFDAIVEQSGNKFVYSKVGASLSYRHIKEAVELLIMAGWVIPVTHTSANGIPLGAEVNPKKRKLFLLDCGLQQRLLGLPLSDILLTENLEVMNKGSIAEQHVALELLKSVPAYHQESLYYWHRESKSSSAEVDFVVQIGRNVVPVEVKSGKKGAMKSMHIFMKEKKSAFGLRFSLENFQSFENIKIIPLYAVGPYYKREQKIAQT